MHLARSGLAGHLLTDAGPLAGSAMFEDVLLDALSVVAMSRNHDFARTTAALSTIEGGLLVLVAGRLTADAAREVAAARRHGRQGIALLLAVSSWASPGRNGQDGQASQDGQHQHGNENGRNGRKPMIAAVNTERGTAPAPAAETAAAEAILRAAGWQVISIDAATPLAVAWQRLPRFGSYAAPVSPNDLGAPAR